MSQTILIDPITRLEGHAKVTLKTNDQGAIEEAQLHITQVRGFEKFSEGRPYYEMPSLMARICGICTVSHLLAGAKAAEGIMAVKIPPTAAKLRRIANLAQCIQSHALSFFHLSSPDLLLGMDAPVEKRHIFGLVESNPEMARAGIQLRRFGQHVIEIMGGKRIHTGWIIPGGVTEALSEAKREEILGMIPQAYTNIKLALAAYKKVAGNFTDEIANFANFPSLFLGMTSEDGGFELTDGKLTLIDANGKVLESEIEANQYESLFAEAAEPYSYMKFPYYRKLGYPDGSFRVGPLPRLNITKHAGTPLADAEFKEFKQIANGPILGSFHYHHARLIEILHGIEVIEQLMSDKSILDTHVRATAGVNSLDGMGFVEAPRGTLFHHYRVNDHGQITFANLIVATEHNNNAMNRGILQAAKRYVKTDKLEEGMLNRVEAVIRTFDPCLSCSTHAFGEMPLSVELVAPDGKQLDKVQR